MGGAVSAGEDNDELVDNLVEAKYIKTPLIERVFRAVDRGNYYLPEHRDNAYKDLAWKHGNLHLSAPCIYSEVMESLDLESGLSFLNIGSGTGYLSTMVGLVIGPYGVNHGIELHADVVEYSRAKLDEFKTQCEVFDEFEFCEPKFVVGNCLLLAGTQLYDRVYCGAACPQEHENFMKNLLKINGLLVMPVNDQLLQVRRTGETTWDSRTVLPVSFASLVLPKTSVTDLVELPEEQAPALQEACRLTIRRVLRARVQEQYPNHGVYKRRRPRRRRQLPKPRDRGVTMMMLGNMDSESDEEIIQNFPRRIPNPDHDLNDSDSDDPPHSADDEIHPSNGRHSNSDSDQCQCDSDNDVTVPQCDVKSMDGSSDDFEIAREPPSNDNCHEQPLQSNGCCHEQPKENENGKALPSNNEMDCDSTECAKQSNGKLEKDSAAHSNGQKSCDPPKLAVNVEAADSSDSSSDDFLHNFYADAETSLQPTTQSPEVASSNHSNSRRRRRLYSGKSDVYSSSPGSAADTESGLGMNCSENNSSSDISPSTSADASEGICMNTIEEESSQSDSEASSARIRLSEILRLRFGGAALHPRLLMEDDSDDDRRPEPDDEPSDAEGEPVLPRNLFLKEMTQKIDQLPLPDQLKAYVGYYRKDLVSEDDLK